MLHQNERTDRYYLDRNTKPEGRSTRFAAKKSWNLQKIDFQRFLEPVSKNQACFMSKFRIFNCLHEYQVSPIEAVVPQRNLAAGGNGLLSVEVIQETANPFSHFLFFLVLIGLSKLQLTFPLS